MASKFRGAARPLPLRAQLLVIAVLIIVYGTVVAIRAGAAPQGVAPHPNELRRCFPKATWNAEPGYRPCAAIRRVYEDGSVVLAVEDANGTTRYTVGVGAKDR